MSKHGYTLVQHSGFGYGGKPGFEKGLEPRQIESAQDKRAIEKAGGVIVADYTEADDLAEKLMYPSDATSMLYPQFAGTFADYKIDGLRVAIPKRVIVA